MSRWERHVQHVIVFPNIETLRLQRLSQQIHDVFDFDFDFDFVFVFVFVFVVFDVVKIVFVVFVFFVVWFFLLMTKRECY